MGHQPTIFFWKNDFTFSPVDTRYRCRFGSGAFPGKKYYKQIQMYINKSSPAVVVYCSQVASMPALGDQARQ